MNSQYSTSVFKVSVHIVLPLIIGTLIYVFFRGIPIINMHPLTEINPPQFIVYNLPDALWFYALLSAVMAIWEYKTSKNFFIWFAIAVLLSLSSEVFQNFKIIPGTFDYKDLIVYAVASLLSLLQLRKPNKSKYSHQKLTV